MRKLAQDSMARLVFRPINEEKVATVTVHDASFAREVGGRSQAGRVTAITDERALQGEAPFCIVEFSSTRIRRVVRSTMAAESAAIADALDSHLFVRVLWNALSSASWKSQQTWQQELAKSPGVSYLVTDGKSLYDHLTSTSVVPKEKQ
eukprot:4344746-Amphidinium_carterae.1